MICNSKITRNEVKEIEESTAKRSCESQCQPQSQIQDASHTSDKQACEQGSSHDISAFSENAIKCGNSLFSSKYQQRDFCKEADCCSVSKNEAQQLSKQSYKFQHSWLFKTSLSFCLTTEIWWAVYVEDEGLYCLLRRKHDTFNLQNKSKIFNKEPCKRFRPEALADHLQTIQHKNTVSAEMLQRVSCFQKTLDERERVAEDVLVKVFTAVYWLMKEELPNNKIKSLLQLLERIGMNDLKHFLHRSQGALREIFLTLGKTVQDTFLCKLKQAAHFGLLVDDVTDIPVAEQMISFAQFYNKSCGALETGFCTTVLENLLCNYVDALKTNIENRFHESLSVVSAWSIFDPLKVPNKDHPGFKLYGKTQVQTIADHFTSSITADQKESIQEEMKPEFAKLKYDMITWKQDLPLECNPSESPCKVTATEWCLQRICSLSHFYPQLSNVADIMISTPASNAWPKRGASFVKRVKTRFRFNLKK